MPVHQVINMVAMRYGFVATMGAVRVGLFIGGAIVLGRAFIRICRGHTDLVVVHMLAVCVM